MYNNNLTKGYLIRSIHIIIIIITISIPFIPFINNKILVLNTVILLVILIFFIIFNGCIISRYERRYLKDKWTPIDILCNTLNIEPTSISRKTVAFNLIIILIVISLIHIYIKVLYN